MTNILIASTHLYIPDRTGGLESSTHELCIALKSKGFNVSVLCQSNPTNSNIDDLDSNYSYSIDKDLGYNTYRALDPVRVLPVVISREKANFVIIHIDKKFELPDAAKLLDAKIIFYIRDVQFEAKYWKLCKFTDAIFIANSKFCASRVEHQFGIKCHVIYPLVSKENYKTERFGNYITFINPVHKKGVEIVLKIASKRPKYKFLFVENWPMTEQQQEYYKTKSINFANITWLNNQTDMRKIYSQTKILIVPSIWEEGWGRVVTEAQINGIPIIASNRGGLIESVGKGGFIIDLKDDNCWINTLDELNTNDSTYLKVSHLALKESARTELSKDYIINSFIELINT